MLSTTTGKWVLAAALGVLLALPLASLAAEEPEPSAAELAAHARDPQVLTAPAATAKSPPATDSSSTEIIHGSGRLVGHAAPRAPQAAIGEDGGITLNFVNADVRDVAKAVFGDFLNANYAIGAGVQGNITVQTSKPLSRSEVLPVLEQILRANGFAIVLSQDVYKLVLSADAQRLAVAPASTATSGVEVAAGYGTQVIQLRYVSAAEMQRVLEPMQPAQAIVHTDTSRNLIIVQGTQQERAAVADEVALFDVDWLAGMSFGLFTPKYTGARGLAHELEQVLGGTDSPLLGMVKLVPIERLNTVMVITKQPRYLDQIQRWIARLDRPGVGSDRRMFVYAVQNGRASDLASVLKKALYGGGRDDQSGDSTTGAAGRTPPSSTAGNTDAAPAPATSAQTHASSLIDDGGDDVPAGAATITADDTTNAIVIYGTPPQYATIESALRQLDSAPLQVLLEAAIAEVTLTNDLKYGMQYFYKPGNDNTLVLSNSNSANIGSAFPGFSYIFSQGTNIRAVLNTMSSVTHVQVISSPEVLVLNNHTATLQVGDQVPIATSQATSVIGSDAPIVNSIDYRPTGIILKVTPRVNQGGMVQMDISQEVSDVSSTSTSTLDSPTITQRKIDSTVAVQDSETVALGGLIKNSKTRGSSGLPFLSEIPVLGALFGTKDNNSNRTELIVLITPHVVDNLQKARAVTDELRRKLPSLQTLLQK